MKKKHLNNAKKTLSVFLTVLMLMSAWVWIAPEKAEAAVGNVESHQGEVTGYVTVDPVIYVHGDNSSGDKYDYMNYGSVISDGSYDGEYKTAVSVSGKTIKSVTVTETGATLGISSGILTGNLGGSYGNETSFTTTSYATLKFTFTDETFEYHRVAVKPNPVDQHAIGLTLNSNTGRRRMVAFEILAYGSAGQATGGSSTGNSSWIYRYNFPSMYDPHNTSYTADNSSSTSPLIGGITSNQISANKVAGYAGTERVSGRNDSVSITVTSPTALYYLDLSSSKNLGVTHTAGGTDWAINLLVGNLAFGSNYYGTGVGYSSHSSTHTATFTNVVNDIKNSEAFSNGAEARATVKISGTQSSTGTISGNFTYTGVHGHTASQKATTVVTMPYQITVVNKANLRNRYNEIVAQKLQSGNYTMSSWNNFKNALLEAEVYLNNSTANTSNETTLLNNLNAYYNSLKRRNYELSYDNLFVFSEWAASDCTNANANDRGTITYDIDNGTITAVDNSSNTTSNDLYTAYGIGTNYYKIPVKESTKYYLDFDVSASGGQCYIFYYSDSAAVNGSDGNPHRSLGAASGAKEITTPAGCTQLGVRFGSATNGASVTFSNIRFYEASKKDMIDEYKASGIPSRTAFNYGTALTADVVASPERAGYTTVNGWIIDADYSDLFTADEPLSNFYGGYSFNASWIVYSDWTPNNYTLTFDAAGGTASASSVTYSTGDSVQMPNVTKDGYYLTGWKVTTADGNWSEGETYQVGDSVSGKIGNAGLTAQWGMLWTVTYYDGNGKSFATVKVKNGESVGTLPNSAPTKSADAEYSYNFVKWTANGTDFTKDTVITSDIEVMSEFNPVSHNFVWQTNVESFATCDAPAKVIKYCSGCGYSLGAVDYDGENANWRALGHAYTGGILSGSDTGNGTHLIKCARYSACRKTIEEAHSWSGNTSEGATCTVPGKIKQICPCGAEQTIDGALDETNHVNTKLINVEAPGCENDGYTGDTYCEDCKKTVAYGEVDPKLGHSFTKYVSNGDATCTKDGTKTAKCDRCDATDTKDDEGSATGHTWKNEGTYLYSAADCENNAVYWQICDVCDISAEADTTGTGDKWTATGTKWNHNFTGDYVDNNNGTHDRKCVNEDCTATGANEECTYGDWTKVDADTHSHTCEFCGYTPAAEAHGWTAWKTVDGATNAAAAQHTRSCPDCKEVETEDCDYKVTDRPETCIAPQLYTYTCNECSHVYYENGKEAKGHDYTGEAKSYNNGQHNFLCANGCNTYGVGETEGTRVGCDYDYDNTKTGEHKATCTECNYSFTEPCSGGQATCTAAAVCDKCEQAYGTTVPHSFKGDAVQLEGDFHAYLCEFCGDETGIYGVGTTENATEACSGGNATCSAKAECEVCGDTHGDYDEDAHKWGAWENIEDTETHKRVCEYNDAHEEIKDCYSPDLKVIAPDCETAGYTLNTCEFCGHEWQTNPTDPLDHDWSAWVDNNNGTHTRTCKDETCKYGENGGAKTETADCTKENAEAVVTEPKCTEGGYTTYTCKDCGYEWVDDETEATGHSFSEKKKKDNAEYKRTDKDCVTDLTYWYCCDNCDVSAETEKDKYENIEDLYWVKTAAAGHSYTAETATEDYLKSAATCTAKAVYYKSCSVCGESSEGKGDKEATFTSGRALGHEWVEPAEDKLADYLATESDCITDATYYYVCNREGCGISSQGVKTDGETWTDTDSKSGHKFDYEGGYTEGKAADCENAGMTEHYTCEICGKHFTTAEATKEIAADKLVIKALGHDWEKVAKKAATCEEDGYTAHEQCQREGCGKKSGSYEVIDAKGHDFKPENGYYTDKGYHYHSYKCSNCDAYGVDGVKYSVDASGLDPEIVGGIPCDFTGEYVNYEDENGLHSHKLVCSCGNEQSAVCADAEPAYVAPTCTEDGYYSYTCDACGYEWTVAGTEEKDQKLGHNLVTRSNGNGTHSATCSRDGCGYKETSQSCSTATPSTVCGSYDICDICKAAFGEAKAHVFTNYVSDNNATCTADGTKTALCDNCDDGTDTVTDKGSKLNHTMTEYGYSVDDWKFKPEGFNETIEESTCCREGKSISYCTGCSLYLTRAEKKDSTKHNWEKDADSEDGLKWVAGAGDCSTGIVMTNKCTNVGCKEVQTKFEAVVDHDYVLIAESLPTCKLEGYRFYKCSLCGNEFFEEGEEAGLAPTNDHKFEVIGETPATCTKNAYVTEQCKVCRDIRIVETEGTMLEHEYIDCKAVAPTCEADGHSAYLKCVDCGAVKDKITAAEDPSYAATGHSDADSDGKCDECYKLLYETEDGEKSCGCICHKESWIMRIIYKILNFFWKLFKISRTCDCGAVHW